MAFYLGRAKLSEKRSKAFVVAPAPPVEIPPLKAPGDILLYTRVRE